MNDKLTLQAITEIFSRQYGISRKATEAFGKSFFDTIVDGLNKDGMVKVIGLGTFKIVDVGSRESINVTNGERIIIDGYKKVAFTPDELAEKRQEEQQEKVEAAVAEAAVEAEREEMERLEEGRLEEDEAAVEARAEEEVDAIVREETAPEHVEVPTDKFSGIDMLISTPESIEEIQKYVMVARTRAEQTLEQAKEANKEYCRLQMLLERMEKNVIPEGPEALEALEAPEVPETPEAPEVQETPEAPEVPETPETPELVVTPAVPLSEEATREEALKRYLSDNSLSSDEGDDEEEGEPFNYWKLILTVILAGLILAALGIGAYRYMKTPEVEIEEDEIEEAVPADSISDKTTDSLEIQKVDTSSPKNDKEAETKTDKETVPATTNQSAPQVTQADNNAPKDNNAVKTEPKVEPKTEVKQKSEPKVESKAKTPARPKTYTLQAGESLTRVSQVIYGTKDSVRAIIKANNFPNPDIVPAGTVIKLP